MSDKIAEIRARHTSDTWRRYELKAQIHDDRATLLAEIERHRAENERLRAQMQEIRERLYLAAGHAAAAALLSEEAHRKSLEGKP